MTSTRVKSRWAKWNLAFSPNVSGYVLLDAADWRAYIVGQEEDGRSRVRLCGVQHGRQFCINNLLLEQQYAAVASSPLGRCLALIASLLFNLELYL